MAGIPQDPLGPAEIARDAVAEAGSAPAGGLETVALRPGALSVFRTAADGGPEPEPDIPNRYEIRTAGGKTVLLCREAPGVAVHIDRELGFSEADARKLGERVILLDGAGAFAPLIDDRANLFNLDHHQDCLRAFTLATCEQALILVLKGVELDKGDWTIYANEPDLDTVFAIWVLLNYRRLRDLDPAGRDAIVPLLRLEGAIDANGLELADYCGLPLQALRIEHERLKILHTLELDKKKSGEWEQLDAPAHTLEMLLRIDGMVYRAADFLDYAAVEQEYGHVEVTDNRVAVICRDGAGIYEVEKRLKRAWGERLVLVALENAPQQYTLRRVAALAGIDLEDAYARLNLVDPAVDGRPPEKRWGGSDDIGGSPRPHGTGLLPQEIAKILRLSYRPVTFWQHVRNFGDALLWTLALVLVSAAAAAVWRLAPGVTMDRASALGLAYELLAVGSVAAFAVWLLTKRLSQGWTWLFGWRWPAGKDYLALLPAMLLGGAAGGVWVPREVALQADPLSAAAGAVVLTALALALWFPGLVHGLLILESRVQTVRGSWFVSWPALVAAVFYTAVTLLASWLLTAGPPAFPIPAPWPWAAVGAGAFLSGLAAAMMRERSLSIWPAVGGFVAGGVVRMLVDVYLG